MTVVAAQRHTTDTLSEEYLRDLATAYAREAATHEAAGSVAPGFAAAFAGRAAGVTARPSFAALLDGIGELASHLAATLDERSHIADSYESMEEFWADAAAQERGQSPRTFWDSYEHGRRRALERVLADEYGSDDAVLLNSGMSAVDVALATVLPRPGMRLLAHRRAYFETTDLLDNVLALRGVRIVRTDLTDAAEIAAAIALGRPDAVLLETALNCPPCDVPVVEALPADVPLVVDNSLFSHAVRLFDLLPDRPLLVVESGTKYLTRDCSAGVLYGRGGLAGAARDTARRVGQQLQSRAFNRLRVGDVEWAAARVALHGNRLRAFADELSDSAWDWTLCPGARLGDRDDVLAGAVRAAGPGCLLFLGAHAADRHAEVVREWRTAVGAARPLIRAGFGWSRTSGRSYGNDKLNQPDAPRYLRVSVGIEPEDVVRELARSLDRTAVKACRG